MNRCQRFWAFLAAVGLALVFSMAWAGVASAQSEEPPPPPVPAGEAVQSAPPPPPPQTVETPPNPPEVLPVSDDGHRPLTEIISAQAALVRKAWLRVGTVFYEYDTIQEAVSHVAGGLLPTDRAVHVNAADDPYTGSGVVIDGANLYLRQLTKMEGNCSSTTHACLAGNPAATVVNANISVQQTVASFTLQNMTVHGTIIFMDNLNLLTLNDLIVTNSAGSAIKVNSQRGAILVTNVKANGSNGHGASLENAVPGVVQPITVRNSSFDDNVYSEYSGPHALDISSNGTITIDGVSASRNTLNGINISTKGAVLVNNVVAVGNKAYDATIAGDGLLINSGFSPSVVVTNVTAMENAGLGMWVYARGAITINGLMTRSNNSSGLMICRDAPCIENPVGTSLVLTGLFAMHNHGAGVIAAILGPVTITKSIANDNEGGSGVLISARGAVAINGLSADGNGGNGLVINNQQTGILAGVTLLDTLGGNELSQNGGTGLDIKTNGAIILAGLSASDNTEGYGIRLDNSLTGSAAITVTRVAASGNGLSGFVAVTRGAFSADSFSAGNNGLSTGSSEGGGILIDNHNAPYPAPVSLSYVRASNNQDGDGLWIRSKGAITIYDLTNASGNGDSGVLLSNIYGVAPVSLYQRINPFSTTVSNNGRRGIEIYSKGAITIDRVQIRGNARSGLLVDNCQYDSMLGRCTGVGGVTLTANLGWTNDFEENGFGLAIVSAGAVTLSHLWVAWNQGGGMVQNNQGLLALPVTVTDGAFNYNGSDGLSVYSRGAITLVDVDANGNDCYDCETSVGNSTRERLVEWRALGGDNWYFQVDMQQDVPLVLMAQFNSVLRLQNCTDYDACADIPGKTWNGTSIDHTENLAAGLYRLIITGATADDFGRYLLKLNHLSADSLSADGAEGLDLNNDVPGSTGGVTIRQSVYWNAGYFTRNSGTGIRIRSRGVVSLGDLRVNDNGARGLDVNLCAYDKALDRCKGTAGLILSASAGGFNQFSNNGERGVSILAYGAITLNRLMANDNAGTGLTLYGCNFSMALGRCENTAPVTITGGPDQVNDFSYNGGGGIFLRAGGPITFTWVSAVNNQSEGAYITNDSARAAYPVTITNGRFDDNHNYDGLAVASRGAITIIDVDASGNDMQSGEIPLGSTVEERLIEDRALAGGSEWWGFTLDATQNVSFYFWAGFSAQFKLQTQVGDVVTDIPGAVWTGNEFSFTRSLAAGTYRVAVKSTATDQWGSYVVSLNDPSHFDWQGLGADGLELSNAYPGSTGGITIRRSSTTVTSAFNDNSGMGLALHTRGAILIQNVEASGNGGKGAFLSSCAWDSIAQRCTALQPVTFPAGYRSAFIGNGAAGMVISSGGPVTLFNIDSAENRLTGLKINMNNTTAPVSLATNLPHWVSGFWDNGGSGLEIASGGSVFISGVGMFNNGLAGAVIDNRQGIAAFPVTITNSNFDNSQNGSGLEVKSRGAVTFAGIEAGGNSGYGVNVDNTSAALSGQPVIINTSSFSNNHGAAGLCVLSRGSILVYSSSAGANTTGNGMILDNQVSGLIQTVSVSGTSSFIGNHRSGLVVRSNRAILISGITSNANGENGLDLNSQAGDIRVVSTHLERNAYNGVVANSVSGSVFLDNVQAFRNGIGAGTNGSGAWVIAANNLVVVTRSAFIGNGAAGLRYTIGAGKVLVWVLSSATGNNVNNIAMTDIYKE